MGTNNQQLGGITQLNGTMPKRKLGRKPLINCVYCGDINMLEVLLNENSPEEADINGWTPIHHAVFKGRFEILQVLLAGTPERKKYLVNLKTRLFETPLTLAFSRSDIMGSLDMIKFLISCQANINHQTTFRETALFRACQQPGTLPIVKYLVENGADPNIGFTYPVHIICSTSRDLELLQYLISVTNFSTIPSNKNEIACLNWEASIPYFLPFITTPSRQGITAAVKQEKWDLLCQLLKLCKDVNSVYLRHEDFDIVPFANDFMCRCYLPIHFACDYPEAFVKVLNAFPPNFLTAYETDKTIWNVHSLPFWISIYSPCRKTEMEALLQYNARHGRHQEIGDYQYVDKTDIMTVREYFTFGECKLPLSLQNMCRLTYKNYVRSQCDNDWQAYCHLRDCVMPRPVKKLLLSNEDFDEEVDYEAKPWVEIETYNGELYFGYSY